MSQEIASTHLDPGLQSAALGCIMFSFCGRKLYIIRRSVLGIMFLVESFLDVVFVLKGRVY